MSATKPTHLIQRGTKRIYPWNPILDKRKDLTPCVLDADGNAVDVDMVDVPPKYLGQISAALHRIDELEQQLHHVTSVVSGMPGGQELLDQRTPYEPPAVPQNTVPASEAMGLPTPGTVTQAATEQSTEENSAGSAASASDDSEAETARKLVEEAKGNVESKKAFLAEQQDRLTRAEAALEEAGEDSPAIEDLVKEAKGASTKVKSATTKLGNAERALADAEAELAELATA